MSIQDKPSALINEKEALDLYLEALLNESMAQPVPETEVVAEIEAIEQVSPAPVAKVSAAAPVQPAWRENTFQALLFKVSGLTLAVPLVELNGVQELQMGDITPMPGHVDWYLGLSEYRDLNVPIVDTAQLILPEDKLENLQLAPDERIRHVVFIDEGRWGLGCDEVDEVITLQENQVSWRSSRTRRRWLAGTVLEQMCALIDPPEFAQLLAGGMDSTEDGESDSQDN